MAIIQDLFSNGLSQGGKNATGEIPQKIRLHVTSEEEGGSDGGGIENSYTQQQNTLQAQDPLSSSSSSSINVNTAETAATEEDPSLGDYVVDAAWGLSAGVNEAINETLDFSWSTGNYVKELFTKGISEASFREPTEEEKKNMLYLPVRKAKYLPGKLVQGIAQFTTGMVGMGKFLKAAKLLQKGGALTKAARFNAQSMGADFFAFDAHEERLGNIVNNIAGLDSAFKMWTAAEDDDSILEGRVKNLIEGVMLDKVGEALFRSLKCIRDMRRAKTVEERKEILIAYADAEQELAEAASKKAEVNTTDAVKKELTQDGVESPPPSNTTDNTTATAAGDDASAIKASTTTDADIPTNTDNTASITKQIADDATDTANANTSNINTEIKTLDGELDGEAETINKNITTSSVDESLKQQETPVFFGSPKNEEEIKYSLEWIHNKLSKILKRHDGNIVAAEEEISISILKNIDFTNPNCILLIKGLTKDLDELLLKNNKKDSHEKLLTNILNSFNDFGIPVDAILEQGQKNVEKLKEIEINLASTRIVFHMITTQMTDLSLKIINGEGTDLDLIRFKTLHEYFRHAYRVINDAATGAGRLLSSLNIKITDKTLSDMASPPMLIFNDLENIKTLEDALMYLAQDPGLRERIMNAVNICAANRGDVAENVKTLAKAPPTTGQYVAQVTKEIYINGLLSSPITSVVNIIGNTIKLLETPTAHLIGSFLSSDKEGMRQARNEFVGLRMATLESLKFFRKAWELNDNILLKNDDARKNAIKGTNLRLQLTKGNEDIKLSKTAELFIEAFDYVGTTVNLPGRFLMATDEVFKQMIFRSRLYSDLCEEAIMKVGYKEGDWEGISRYVTENFKHLIDKDGKAVVSEITENAIRQAQEGTWSQELGSWGQTLQRLGRHDNLSGVMTTSILPFVNTPTNLLKDFIYHTPIGTAQGFLSEAGRKRALTDPLYRKELLGKLAISFILANATWYLVAEGKITGSLSLDPKVRKMQYAAGIQPYSIKIGDTWVSYKKADPYGMFIGTVADIYNAMQDEEATAVTIGDGYTAIVPIIAFTKNVTSKTYLKGLVDMLSMITEPEKTTAANFESYLLNFVPFSSLMRETRKTFDPTMREANDLGNTFLNIIPGRSRSLPARYNWITGKPIEASLFPTMEHDSVMAELVRLSKGIQGEPTRTLKGIRLNDEQYARYKELHGTVLINGKNLYETLQEVFENPQYDIAREYQGDAPFGETGFREKYVRGIINAYRETAQQQLREEFSDLDDKIFEREYKRKASRSGILTSQPVQDPRIIQELKKYRGILFD